MLREIKQNEFDKYIEFAYALALDMTKSSYPTYADGIKTKQEYVEKAKRSLTEENSRILLYERGGRVAGWIDFYFMPEDRYIGVQSFCASEGMGEAIAEFVDFAEKSFPGNTLYLGFPKENKEAVAAFDSLGLERIEESCSNALALADYKEKPVSESVVPITRENYALFSELHKTIEGDMYWNSERILAALDDWRVYVYLKNGRAAGAVYNRIFDEKTLSEIFGVDFPDRVHNGGIFRELVCAALNDDKRRGTRYNVFFSDDENEKDTRACGFRLIGGYVCYKKEL